MDRLLSKSGCELKPGDGLRLRPAVDAVLEISCLSVCLPLQVQKPNSIPVLRFHVKKRSLARLVCVASFVVLVTSLAERLRAQTANSAAAAFDIVITAIEGKVEVLRSGAQTW